jgi:hypothetical protein
MLKEIYKRSRFVFQTNVEEHQRESVRESRLGIETNENGVFQTGSNKASERLRRKEVVRNRTTEYTRNIKSTRERERERERERKMS